MLAEWKGLEYVLEILRVLHRNPGKADSGTITNFLQADGRMPATQSYVQKILPRMVKCNLLISSSDGYVLARPIDDIMVSDVLDFCAIPDIDCPLQKLCLELKKAVSLSSINEFYDF
jgi:DNA-binding IscR family transcriptional regulator